MSVSVRSFGMSSSGEAKLYTLKAGRCAAEVTDFGATLVSFMIEDEGGVTRDVVLGYDDAAGYEAHDCFFGATVGRNANRIGGASFVLNGEKIQIPVNENTNNLHSGPDVYGTRLFQVEEYNENGSEITFTLDSPDGDQGFPGNLKLVLTYTLEEDGSLRLHYHAVSDKDTVFNPTNHAYFNLNGHTNGDICGQYLQLIAPQITPIKADCIPTGELLEVKDTPFDFNDFKMIGKQIGEVDNEQICLANGYDHNFCLDTVKGNFRKVAEAYSDKTDITLEVSTDLPGLQFYTGNFIPKHKGKDGATYDSRSGFALESQFYPDCMNKPTWPRPILKAGEEYDTETVYRLSIKKH